MRPGTPVLVRRGRRYVAAHGRPTWSRGWWAFHLRQLARSLGVATIATLGVVGDIAVETTGMAIGGA
eukprot:6995392-Lingulodinium_polyedra.AAC.1